MSPLPLLIVVAVKVFGLVTPPAETRNVCNDSNFTIVSVSIGFDICARIKIISQPCCASEKFLMEIQIELEIKFTNFFPKETSPFIQRNL